VAILDVRRFLSPVDRRTFHPIELFAFEGKTCFQQSFVVIGTKNQLSHQLIHYKSLFSNGSETIVWHANTSTF